MIRIYILKQSKWWIIQEFWIVSSWSHFSTFWAPPRHRYWVMSGEKIKVQLFNQYSLFGSIGKSYEIGKYILKTSQQWVMQEFWIVQYLEPFLYIWAPPRYTWWFIRSEKMKVPSLNQYSLSDSIKKSGDNEIYILKHLHDDLYRNSE